MKPLQALLALFACAFLPLHAAGLDDLTYTPTNGEVTITDCDTAATGELVIPNTIEGNPVTSIGNNAFRQCGSLTSITIPDSVTSIGDDAFRDCTSLTSITIGNGVKSIGLGAFRDCSSLTSITIGNGVKSIGLSAFEDCTSLKNITIPDSVTSIGGYAFYDCTSLTSVTFQGGAPTVGSEAFTNTPDGAVALVTSANPVSFGENGSSWNGLTLEVIPVLSWITNNGEITITDCDETATGELIIPDTIEGNVGFLPVTSIGSGAFNGCTSLTSITIPDSVTSLGDYAFDSCTSLTSITIPDGVTSIGIYAFYGCSSLTSITIPESVANIGDGAFALCSSLVSVNVINSNVNFTEINGVLFDAEMELLLAYPAGKNDLAYNIPNSVTSIGEGAFSSCTSLTSITIPEGVISIGAGAFYGCTSLTSITIPDSVTSIERSSFNGCQSLTNITIGNGVTSIGDTAFAYCTSLTSITFMGVAPTVGASAFSGVSDGAVAYALGSTSFGESGDNWNGLTVQRILTFSTTNEEVTITDCDETSIGELVIPDTIGGNPVTSIGDSAFRDCGSLTSITIPGSVTSIGVAAFRDCTSLTSMTIPDSVISIGGAAFYQCTGLTNITIPDGVTSIENGTFRGCISLTSITIPDGVTSIGGKAFRDCTSLTSITFMGAAPTVGSEAFSGVANGAVAYVSNEGADSFGGFGSTWEGLTVAIQRVTITDCGFVNATTYFIEFEPAGAGYRVMSSPTLNFGNAVEVTPTLEPTSGSDNRFEFTASGSRNFYRLEPTE